MSTTTSVSDSEYQGSEGESSNPKRGREETRLFWSDGQVMGEKYQELHVPEFNSVESGYLADDESDNEEDDDVKTRTKQKPLSCSHSMSSSLFHSDSDGFEERAVL